MTKIQVSKGVRFKVFFAKRADDIELKINTFLEENEGTTIIDIHYMNDRNQENNKIFIFYKS